MLTDLARTWGALAPSHVPASARRVAGQCILDWVGCAAAGATEPAVSILLSALEPPDGASSLVVGGTARPRDAALVNGTAGHALDFDDTSTAMRGHPTAPVLPAVLALAEHLDTTGEQLLNAFIIGVEIETRLGAAIGGAHYAKGWHATATIGVMGAAAACARLLDLDADRFAQALGMAASQSAGLRANFGTMTKPLHAGSAAERGLTSALLAAEGFTANSDAFAAKQGLVGAAGDGSIVEAPLGDHDFAIVDTLFKYHASCYLTHAALNAVEAIPDRPAAKSIGAVVVTVNPALLDICGIPEPTTGLHAKFSLRGVTALALLGHDTTDSATFTDAVVQDTAVQELLRRVEVHTDPAVPESWTRVAIDDLEAVEADTSTPERDLDRQEERLRHKFAGLADGRLGEEALAVAGRLLDTGSVNSARDLMPTWQRLREPVTRT
jgi:2-methylcitrate dehydratase PrpD